MKALLKFVSITVFLAAFSVAQAQVSAPPLQRAATFTLMNATTSASAGTTAITGVTGLDTYGYCVVYAKIQGATNGTLDFYVQTSFDGGTSWVDVGHFAQLAAGAAAVGNIALMGRGGTALSYTPIVVNTASGTPVLAANTFLAGVLGNALRVVYVAGAGTTAGAAQTITAYCTSI